MKTTANSVNLIKNIFDLKLHKGYVSTRKGLTCDMNLRRKA